MLRLLAPAKLNLYLRVVAKRPDGYHELETVFERIDLADELLLEPRIGDLSLTCADSALSCGEDNLIVRAGRLLQAVTKTSHGATLQLIKRIPIAAGLGGGSSDAAAALLGLNELWGLGLSRVRLTELAARLGSDVPFFLGESPFAIGRGRGERCEPLPAAGPLAHVLVVPHAQLLTKDIYARSRFGLTASGPSLTMVAHALSNGSLGELASGLRNDLEPEAIRRCPVIAQIQAQVRLAGAHGVLVSGSGPAVFGLCDHAAHAQAVTDQLSRRADHSWRIMIVQTLDRIGSLAPVA